MPMNHKLAVLPFMVLLHLRCLDELVNSEYPCDDERGAYQKG